MVKVSVIIPVYNVEQYLEECLDSVLNQTLKDIEIICVDDGSTDGSANILEKYSKRDKRLKVLTKENGGASSARNMALADAIGEYIYFLDSDDYIREDALQLLYEKAEKNELDITLFGAVCFVCDERTGNKTMYKERYYTRDVCLDEIFTGKRFFYEIARKKRFNVTVVTQFFNRKFLIGSGVHFHEGIIYEDELFTPLILIRAKKVMCLPDNLYMRRDRPNSVMTSKISYKNIEAMAVVFMELRKELTLWEQDFECREGLDIRCRAVFNAAVRYYRRLDEHNLSRAFLGCENETLLSCKGMIEKEATEHGCAYYFMQLVKSGIDCCKENGVIYTIKLLCGKIKEKLKLRF